MLDVDGLRAYVRLGPKPRLFYPKERCSMWTECRKSLFRVCRLRVCRKRAFRRLSFSSKGVSDHGGSMRMRRTHVIASPSVMMYAEHRTKVVLSVGLVMMSGCAGLATVRDTDCSCATPPAQRVVSKFEIEWTATYIQHYR